MSIDVLAVAKAKAQEAFKQDATPFTNKDRLKLRHIEEDIKELKHIEEDIKELKQILTKLETKLEAMAEDLSKPAVQVAPASSIAPAPPGMSNLYTEFENAWVLWHFHRFDADYCVNLHNQNPSMFPRNTANGMEIQYGKLCTYLEIQPSRTDGGISKGIRAAIKDPKNFPFPDALRDRTALKLFLNLEEFTI